ncbi:MAG: S9 family peptidase [Planctomycetota bacterium]
MSPVARFTLFLAIAAALALAPVANAQEPYQPAPPAIAAILDAPPLPYVSVSPGGNTMLLLHRENLPPISEMARPMLRLAGRRIDPAKNASHGPRSVVGITVKPVHGGTEWRLPLPADVGIGFPIWSPDGERFAFTVTHDDGVALWLGSVHDRAPRALTGRWLNTLGVGPRWMPDGRHLLVGAIPEGRGPAPERPATPVGPVIQESLGGEAAPVRTYQDLLGDAHDEALYDHYHATQLALIDAGSGQRTDLGAPAVYYGADPSPLGDHLLVQRIERPYSYLVPSYRFERSVEVWNRSGEVVAELARLPLGERVPIGGVILGPRSHAWRATEGSEELYWVEALDGGDPNREADHRDRLMALAAPFADAPREVLKLEDRYWGTSWLAGRGAALVSEYDRDERWTRTWLIDAANGSHEPRLLADHSIRDAYGDPGDPVMTRNSVGRSVVRVSDGAIFLRGQGASPEGDRPFLDRVRLSSFDAQRMWRNAGDEYESLVEMLPQPDGSWRLLTRAETPTEPPNYFVRDLRSGDRHAVTAFEHPAPELLGIHKELVTYERDDGVQLSATLYLPPGYERGADGELPLLVWAYPREFNDPANASQVRGSPHRFTMFGGSSHLFLLTQGYAIMDGATMPVVGSDPETVNDTFLVQIVASAAAAIDKAAEMGVGDPERVGVGGHSYGAFMTANLLAHSDLFRAGVARSGAYNRTLTPFGFQAERRTFWEAPDTYFELSPFMHADQIDEPMLMIHGEEDNNSGTFPIQSERMYHAVKGHGGTARLVMLPHESHGYRARESVMHTLAEMTAWLDTWVKNAGPRGASE